MTKLKCNRVAQTCKKMVRKSFEMLRSTKGYLHNLLTENRSHMVATICSRKQRTFLKHYPKMGWVVPGDGERYASRGQREK
jgi:hypothetical protein